MVNNGNRDDKIEGGWRMWQSQSISYESGMRLVLPSYSDKVLGAWKMSAHVTIEVAGLPTGQMRR